MFPFISEQTKQTASYDTFKAKQRRNKYSQSPEEREASEQAFKAEYGADYIEDEPVTLQEIKNCLTRVNSKANATAQI